MVISEGDGLGSFICAKIDGLGSTFVESWPDSEAAV